MKKILKAFSLLMVATLALFLAACGGGDSTDPTVTPSDDPSVDSSVTPTPTPTPTPSDDNTVDYTVEVKTVAGKGLSDFYITIYLGNEEIDYAITDNDGIAVFTVEPNYYDIYVEGVDGYDFTDDHFETDIYSETFEVVCETYLIEEEAPAGNIYVAGEAMYDFTLTDPYGNKINLVSLFEEGKEAVILNFWYVTCSACVSEFPYMDAAYKETYTDADGNEVPYSDDIAFISINPGFYEADTNNGILTYKNQNNFTVDMLLDNVTEDGRPELTDMFEVKAYPTTVVIDRYGSISLIEEGAVTSINEWTALFDKYIDPNYVQDYEGREDEEDVEQVIPTVTWPEAGVLENVLNGTNYDDSKFNATYRPDADDEYSWPFVPSEDGTSVVPTNVDIDNSYSIMYTDITLKKDEVFAFEYYSSCESYDYLYVLVDGIIVSQISSISSDWENCYSYPAIADGTYEVCFIYMKDTSDSAGDDVVYLRNFHICEVADIDKETYTFREASYGEVDTWNNEWTNYVSTVYNPEDGYYHVDTIDGPILFADLLSGTHWSDDNLYAMAEAGELADINGNDYTKLITNYSSYASNSGLGYVPVTEELAAALKNITKVLGHEEAQDNQNQWLEVCVYYSAYAADGEFEPSIQGIAPFAPFEFEGDADSGTASAYFDKVLIPRGYIFKFVPEKSGVYKFTTIGEEETNGWICGSDAEIIYNEDDDLRSTAKEATFSEPDPNFISYQYYEAGQTYFIRAGFYDIYLFAEITVSYEYIGEELDVLKLCSPGYFTSSDDDMSDIISTGIKATLGEDGFYHTEDATGADNFVYVDFKYLTPIFSHTLEEQLSLNGFNFALDEDGRSIVDEEGYLVGPTYDEDDNLILDEDGNIVYDRILDDNGDPILAPENIKDYTTFVQEYMAEHMITDETSELYGCAKVNEEMMKVLQLLMDKYTFAGVENSWLKLCYYYKHIAA